MTVKFIPPGHNRVSPYVLAPGADRLIEFLAKAFGAEELFRFNDGGDKIRHAEVRIGDSVVMLSDSEATAPMIHIYAEDVDAAYRRAIEAGATSLREPSDQVYGDRSAGVTAFGYQWWIATRIEELSVEEMKTRMK